MMEICDIIGWSDVDVHQGVVSFRPTGMNEEYEVPIEKMEKIAHHIADYDQGYTDVNPLPDTTEDTYEYWSNVLFEAYCIACEKLEMYDDLGVPDEWM